MKYSGTSIFDDAVLSSKICSVLEYDSEYILHEKCHTTVDQIGSKLQPLLLFTSKSGVDIGPMRVSLSKLGRVE